MSIELLVKETPPFEAGRRPSGALRLVLAEDDPLVQEVVARLLAVESDLSLVAVAGSGEEAIQAVQQHVPDLLLLDLRMSAGDGFSVLQRLARSTTPPHVLILSGYSDTDTVVRALRAGATGFLAKQEALEWLIAGVRAVGAGEHWISPKLAARLSSALPRILTQGGAGGDASAALTDRERQVAELVARGASNREIAERLGMREGTVKAHVSRVLEKLALENRTQLALRLQEAGAFL